MAQFQPRILAFCCNWCSYAGADLCGVSRFQYPPNIRIIRVMCSGRVEPVFLLKAFKAGIDGVLVLGCHLGDCHYISGNNSAQAVMEKAFDRLEAPPARLTGPDVIYPMPRGERHYLLTAEQVLAEARKVLSYEP